jgi:hypothetical protein
LNYRFSAAKYVKLPFQDMEQYYSFIEHEISLLSKFDINSKNGVCKLL